MTVARRTVTEAHLPNSPSHLSPDWGGTRLKYLAEIRTSNVDKKSVEGERVVRLCNYTDVYYGDRITNDMDFMVASASPSAIARFGLRRGDVVITKDSESRTDIAVPAYVAEDLNDVVCGYHLTVLRPKRGRTVGRFLHYAVQADGIRGQFHLAASGITRFGLSYRGISDARVPVPPIEVQQRIADLLDRETAHIDAMIKKKERLIQLLDEKRTALITQAVTKGLNPDAPMKDSGVERIGEIPEHWEVAPLGRFTDAIEQGWSPLAEDRPAHVGEWAVIKLSAVKAGEFFESEHKALPAGLNGDHRFEIREGDLLITRANTPELVATACVVPDIRDRLMMCDLVYRVHVRDTVVYRGYLAYWLMSAPARSHVEVEARGASRSMVKVSQGLIRRWPCVLPPMTEQREVATYLEGADERSRIVAERTRRSITLLRERRSALITAAVTGQLDIPEDPS